MVKIFQFLRLSTKFLVVLRLSVNPIETLLKRLFQSEARSETRCIDMKKIFYSHANKMAVFMPTLMSSCVVHTHLTDDFNV